MARDTPLPDLGTELERRIQQRLRRFEPDDPRLRETLLRIGLVLESEAKLNVRRQGIIDTGRLLNSIRAEFYRKRTSAGVLVGSFGVPYAAMHEFGGPFTDVQRRAMFAALRDRGKLGPVREPGKGVIQGNRFVARPYLRPSLLRRRDWIVSQIRALFRG